MFCFPILDHVIVPLWKVSVTLKFRPLHVHPRAYVRMIYEKTKGKFPGEYHVVWIGKTKHTSLGVYSSNVPVIAGLDKLLSLHSRPSF